MCHECLAGSQQLPFEHAGHQPAWAETEYKERPFDVMPIVAHIPFEANLENGPTTSRPDERMFRRDIFHNTKVGLMRDFVGSTVMILCRLKYFSEAGASNDRPTLLDRAYRHFYLFCKTAN